METFVIKIANINIKVSCLYASTKSYCKDYIVDDDNYDFSIEINDELIQLEKSYVPNIRHNNDELFESGTLYRQIGERLPLYNAFILHGAAIEYKNKTIVFVAPSGTGKSTHANLWIKNLKGAKILNGDKPIIRLIDNVPYVFGTPWMGKEYIGYNGACPLDSIVILKRGDVDTIKKVDKTDHLEDIVSKVYIPKKLMVETFDLIDKVYKNISVYELHCTMNNSAFITSFEEITGEKYEG